MPLPSWVALVRGTGGLFMENVELTIATSYSYHEPQWWKTYLKFLVTKWNGMTLFMSVEDDFTVRNSFKPCLQLSFKVQLQTLENLFWSELSQSWDLLGERMHLDNWKTSSAVCGSLAESQSTLEMGRRENKTRDPSTTSSSEEEPVSCQSVKHSSSLALEPRNKNLTAKPAETVKAEHCYKLHFFSSRSHCACWVKMHLKTQGLVCVF